MVIFAGLAVFPSGSVKLCGESPTGSVKKFTKKRPVYKFFQASNTAPPDLLSAGLFLVNFFTEPVGLSPHNFTEPDGKTASPAKITISVYLLIM